MKKALRIIGSILLLLVVALVAFTAFRYFKMKNFKDTHDLQDKIEAKCNKYINDKKSVGLAIGIIQGDKVYTRGFGYLDLDKHKLVDTSTIFEIGSITKVFTAELAQILADKGSLNWNENIWDVLPVDYRAATRDSTTLLNLVTHTSGFPRSPSALLENNKNPCNPYSGITTAEYALFIKNPTDKKRPDTTSMVYSNLGFSVLTDCIEIKAGCKYDSLLQREILSVLKMNNTTLHVSDTANFATGYDNKQDRTCHWDFAAMYGAGAIRSTISDMLLFLKANLSEGPLYKPFTETQKEVYRISVLKGDDIGKAWHYDQLTAALTGTGKIIWHNGGTGGFRSYIALVPEKNTGIVVLSNQSSDDFDGLAIGLMADAARISLK